MVYTPGILLRGVNDLTLTTVPKKDVLFFSSGRHDRWPTEPTTKQRIVMHIMGLNCDAASRVPFLLLYPVVISPQLSWHGAMIRRPRSSRSQSRDYFAGDQVGRLANAFCCAQTRVLLGKSPCHEANSFRECFVYRALVDPMNQYLPFGARV
ncbi:hypothetical protein H4582DRAFT_1053595 [Lactarius indigo]|nr:hypothetical protein H4582DRAFT_1053595 [Lactarius indigo]